MHMLSAITIFFKGEKSIYLKGRRGRRRRTRRGRRKWAWFPYN